MPRPGRAAARFRPRPVSRPSGPRARFPVSFHKPLIAVTPEPWFQLRNEPRSDGMWFALPPRPGGPIRAAGSMLLVVGFVDCLVTLAIGSGLVESSATRGRLVSVVGIFLLIMFVPGVVALIWGALWRWGHTEVFCREGRLRVSEVWGWLRVARRLPKQPPLGLEICRLGFGRVPFGASATGGGFRLKAIYAGAPAATVAMGYPNEWLEALARELRPLLSLASSAPPPLWVEGDATAAAEADAVLVSQNPPSGRLQVEEAGGRLRITAGPTGLRGSALLLFRLALIWLGIVGFVGALFLRDQHRKETPEGSELGGLLALVGFTLVGVGMGLTAIHLARRRVVLEVDSLSVEVVISGLWPSRRHQWRRADLTAVGVGDSSIEVGGRKLPELQFHFHSGTVSRLLVGFDEAALRWMAARLRQKLQLPGWPGARATESEVSSAP